MSFFTMRMFRFMIVLHNEICAKMASFHSGPLLWPSKSVPSEGANYYRFQTS